MAQASSSQPETIKNPFFAFDSSAIVFGPGATREVGSRLRALGCSRVLLITDAQLVHLAPVVNTVASLEEAGVAYEVFDRVRIEPSDASLQEAITVAVAGEFEGYVSVGGGSTIDTAKIANLYATWPADFLDYVAPPFGQGVPVPGLLKPHVAVPTTAGTGSETTANAVFDLPSARAKTAIGHRELRPTLGIIDPENTRSQPPMVAASVGLDVLCHAIESYTAVPYYDNEVAVDPSRRPPYGGANPVSDLWCAEAITLAAQYLERAVNDPEDDEARTQMLFASTIAGIGFGNAGVHLPHAMSYPISGLARQFVPPGYPDDHPIVPHGMSVILTAPAVFRWTAQADPVRHLEAARLMGADAHELDAGKALADALVHLMRRIGMPNGLNGVGITMADMDVLVQGTLPQSRITRLAQRVPTPDELQALFADSMTLW